MTNIKTAQVKGRINEYGSVNLACGNTYGAPSFVAVEGLTESEVHEAAALLEKSREVCEWERDCFGRLCDCDGESHSTSKHSNGALVKFCPSCGRKVVVK